MLIETCAADASDQLENKYRFERDDFGMNRMNQSSISFGGACLGPLYSRQRRTIGFAATNFLHVLLSVFTVFTHYTLKATKNQKERHFPLPQRDQ